MHSLLTFIINDKNDNKPVYNCYVSHQATWAWSARVHNDYTYQSIYCLKLQIKVLLFDVSMLRVY